jgi:Ca-activated chloride channel family protein
MNRRARILFVAGSALGLALCAASCSRLHSAGAPGRHQNERPGPSYASFGEPYDEVWVVRKPDTSASAPAAGEIPGEGELRAVPRGQDREIPLPLRHTDVKAAVQGYLASVRVTQQYQNPYDSRIEAVYVFPLPENAAVSDFVMRIGTRRIRGIIRERGEAERVYQEARDQGYVASLLTQERPNVFTQKVANIEPGKRIDVEIAYFHTLAYADGEYTFVFPMVVGPRYNPPGFTSGVGAAGRGERGASGQRTEVTFLRPGERSGHDVSLSVDLDAGVAIEGLRSPSHLVDVRRIDAARAQVQLRPSDAVPNKDFILSYRVAGNALKAALAVERKPGGNTFTLMLQPPASLSDLPRSELELVYVIDVSGSQSGWPIERSKAAVRRSLRHLLPGDTFQMVRFAAGAGAFAPRPVPATPENVERALAWVDRLDAGGGTEMLRGIRAALDFPHDPRRLRMVSFFSDGFIGNDDEILAAVAENLGPSRIFAFGVGSSTNRYLIEGLARIGRGAVAYLTTGDSDVSAVDRFFETIGHPALTDVTIDWGGMVVEDVYPARVPDLFVGRPVVLVGRFQGRGATTVTISGMAGGARRTYSVRVDLETAGAGAVDLSKIWARAHIAHLTDQMLRQCSAQVRDEIRATALAHGLLSSFTAFLAVDTTRRTEGTSGTTVDMPVPVPEGTRYETTVPQHPGPAKGGQAPPG